jgi:hypothetical protein
MRCPRAVTSEKLASVHTAVRTGQARRDRSISGLARVWVLIFVTAGGGTAVLLQVYSPVTGM